MNQRAEGIEVAVPTRPWVPNPGLWQTVGKWDQALVERFGMEARFERPSAWETAVLIATAGGAAEQASAIATLDAWSVSFRDEVLALLPRARRAT